MSSRISNIKIMRNGNNLIAGLAFMSVSLFSNNALAAWDYITVCDKEWVVTQEPMTSCAYGGSLYSDRGNLRNFYTSGSMSGHGNCVESHYVSDNQTIMGETHYWSGFIPLASQNHYYDESGKWVDIPSTCRVKKIWVNNH
ncbi:hypothetical protein [Aliikangiella coralliicola]|uniref:Secreted protein n=1 Tax=Aliikangiella coralliicola TaxID=2592383 RepID=A0A545UIL6_9GAMM|nr:hypothetical protein [Aliikangiella coralliicola]TQV89307.1 hypothetical protein FLL46_00015 [Aliikangiella coralliicola]